MELEDEIRPSEESSPRKPFLAEPNGKDLNADRDESEIIRTASGNLELEIQDTEEMPRWKQMMLDLVDTVGDWVYVRTNSYFWLHLIGWTIMSLVWSGFLAAGGASSNMPYIDSLFYSVSTVTGTGLTTRDLSTETISIKILLFVPMMFSGAVFESSIPVFHRLLRLRKLRKQPEISESYHQTLNHETSTAVILCVLIWTYYFLVQIVAFIVLGFYTQYSTEGWAVMEANNINPWWWTTYQVFSSFNNCGLTLVYNSVVQFNTQMVVLIFVGTLVLMGYTAYPVFLRAAIVIIQKSCVHRFPKLSETCQYLLENPRNHMTHLFPKFHTWWLVITLILFNVSQTILMIALDQKTPAFSSLGSGYTVANAAFQSIMVRASGLNSINVADLKIESQVFMILMMYVAAYPITILVRSTNESEKDEGYNKVGFRSTTFQLSRLLVNDMVWIVVAWYLICAIQGYTDGAQGFSALFEVVSAYGTVGLSLGLSCCAYSFSGSFSTASKLVIIVAMLLGRHRGMPDNIDSAISLDYDSSIQVPLQHRPSVALGRRSISNVKSGISGVSGASATGGVSQSNSHHGANAVSATPE